MPPIIETQRLRLRPPVETDLLNIFRLGTNPKVMQFITKGKTQSLEEARADLNRRIEQSGPRFGYWITEERHSGNFVGWLVLKPLEQTGEIELGYRFLEEMWGRGYATEGSQAILQYAFNQLKLKKVVAVALEENKASTRVMEKVGMHFKKYDEFYGAHCVYYSIGRDEYQLVASEKVNLE